MKINNFTPPSSIKNILQPNLRDLFIIAIIILAISLRFYLGPMNSGTFIDEYNHIYAAKGINEIGLFSYLEGETSLYSYLDLPYTRGLHISILIAGLFRIFDFSLFAARLAPFLISIGILILLYFLARNFLDKWMTGIFLFMVGIVPWLLFSHIYIREYIVIQFLFLGIILIFLKLRKMFLKEDLGILLKSKTFFLLSISLLACIKIFLLTNSYLRLLIFPIIGILISISYFEFLIRKSISDYPSSYPAKILLFTSIIILIFSIIFFSEIRYYLIGEINASKPNPPDLYWNFFTGIYKPFSILFSIGIFYFLLTEDKKKDVGSYLLLLFFGLLFLHQRAPSRQIRFIGYLFPIFFIFVAKGLEPLFIKMKKILTKIGSGLNYSNLIAAIIILLCVTLILLPIYPKNFLNTVKAPETQTGPYYMDWGKACEFLKDQNASESEDLVISLMPQSTELRNIRTDFMLRDGEDEPPKIWEMTGTKNIKSRNELQEIIKSNKDIWIVIPSWRKGKISKESWKIIKNKFSLVKDSENWVQVELYKR